MGARFVAGACGNNRVRGRKHSAPSERRKPRDSSPAVREAPDRAPEAQVDPLRETILGDLGSREPTRIQAALQALMARCLPSTAIPVAPPGAELFEPFGDAVPESTALEFLDLVTNYPGFVPRLTLAQKIAVHIAMALRYGGQSQLTYQVQLALKIARDPGTAIKIGMAEVERHGIQSARHLEAARYLVSCLLDGTAAVRKATLKTLRRWPAGGPFEDVREYITPQLEPDELASLQTNNDADA